MNHKFIDVTASTEEIFRIDQSGDYTYFLFNQSKKVELEIMAPHVNVDILGIYVGTEKNEFALKTNQHHKVGNNQSNLLVKGILFDQSKFDYEGLIKIEPGAQLTHAYQKNQNLILGEHAKVSSKPFLEIEADDVFCTHGSTTGQISEEQTLFIQSRGIDSEKAKQMITFGFLKEIFDIMKSSGISEESLQDYHQQIFTLLEQNYSRKRS